MQRERIAYFATSAWKRVLGIDCKCPNCASPTFVVIDRKYLVTELRRCRTCRLLYRAPSDSAAENDDYYQATYSSGFTTAMPSEAVLEREIASGFPSANHDYGYFISLLTALGVTAGKRLFDFGCSWGYGAWQFQRAGLDVTAYDVSRPRAAFAREKLGVDVLAEMPTPGTAGSLRGTFDCFFSSHVIEHVPQPKAVIDLAQSLLKPGGYFVAVTPNGSQAFRVSDPNGWHHIWGKRHPNLIDAEYWQYALGRRPTFFATSPVDPGDVVRFRQGDTSIASTESRLDRSELVCISKFG